MRLVGRWRNVRSSGHSGIRHRGTCQLGIGIEMWELGLCSPLGPVHELRYILLFLVEWLEMDINIFPGHQNLSQKVDIFNDK